MILRCQHCGCPQFLLEGIAYPVVVEFFGTIPPKSQTGVIKCASCLREVDSGGGNQGGDKWPTADQRKRMLEELYRQVDDHILHRKPIGPPAFVNGDPDPSIMRRVGDAAAVRALIESIPGVRYE